MPVPPGSNEHRTSKAKPIIHTITRCLLTLLRILGLTSLILVYSIRQRCAEWLRTIVFDAFASLFAGGDRKNKNNSGGAATTKKVTGLSAAASILENVFQAIVETILLSFIWALVVI
ncbi:hypothetical protein GGR51DRAFT_554529 [Nemania sp. FL0031]|nr:hypothetical protein GGR51DRAFT_554529 [Nemania sp. FL0031]